VYTGAIYAVALEKQPRDVIPVGRSLAGTVVAMSDKISGAENADKDIEDDVEEVGEVGNDIGDKF